MRERRWSSLHDDNYYCLRHSWYDNCMESLSLVQCLRQVESALVFANCAIRSTGRYFVCPFRNRTRCPYLSLPSVPPSLTPFPDLPIPRSRFRGRNIAFVSVLANQRLVQLVAGSLACVASLVTGFSICSGVEARLADCTFSLAQEHLPNPASVGCICFSLAPFNWRRPQSIYLRLLNA